MKTLILCGYRDTDPFEEPLGLARDEDGISLIDRKIAAVRDLGMDPVCVLAGAGADAQLRLSRQMQYAELAFDTSAKRTLIGNALAGATLFSNEAFFVLPVEIPMPHPSVWAFLRNEYAKVGFNAAEAALQVGAKADPIHYGFPLLITRSGAERLQSMADLQSLVDARLTYLHLALETKPL